MYINVRFRFGDLPPEHQAYVLDLNRGRESYSNQLHHGGGICSRIVTDTFFDRVESIETDQFLVISIDFSNSLCKLPNWLANTTGEITIEETFCGFAQNGLYREGVAKAEVNTFPRDVKVSYPSESDEEYDPCDMNALEYSFTIISTKILVTGNGKCGDVFKNALSLYRMIRSGTVDEQHTIEVWPTRIVGKLVTVGAENG